jgi:hypothetical protein
MSEPNGDQVQSVDELGVPEVAEGAAAAAPGQILDQPLQAFQPANQPPGPHGQLLSSVE